MMDCGTVSDRLEGYHDGILERPDRRELKRHLDRCAPCRGELDRVRAIEEAFRAAGGAAPKRALSVPVRGRWRERLPSGLVAAALLGLLFFALTPGADGLIRSAKSGPWSDPATWEKGAVPGAGARVQVRSGHTVVYDVVSDRPIRVVHVAGTLDFARDRDTRLDVGLIKVQAGEEFSEDGFSCDARVDPAGAGRERPALRVGRPDEPVGARHTALIRLVYFDGMDKKTCPAIVTCGGLVEYHGAPMNRTWVKLGRTAAAGGAEVVLSESVTGWKAGDKVIVTSTKRPREGKKEEGRWTFRPGADKRRKASTEERTVRSIEGTKVLLDQPLEFEHLGDGDFRGEIANLSRNVIVESADPAKERGHTMWHRHSAGGVSYAEFRHLGKEGVLGKYSLHFHLVGNSMRGSQVLGASVWDSANRWITIHGTNYLVVRDCVGYQSVGHGFFMEDGTEVYNVLDRNLAVQAYKGRKLPGQVLPFDGNEGAGFWWANNLNTFTRNVSCENDLYGYRGEATPSPKFDLRMPILQPDGARKTVDLRTLPFVRFDDNEAHSDGFYGVRLGDCVAERLGPDEKHPHVIRGMKIWDVHYGFRPEIPSLLVENMKLWKADYGVYHPDYDRHAYRNISISESTTEAFNRGHDDLNRQHGPLTVDGMTLERCKNHIFQVSQRAPDGNADSHFRNVTFKDNPPPYPLGWVDVPPNGGQTKPPPLDPVPYYFHDWFGPGRHAKILTADMVEKAKDGLTYVDCPFPSFGRKMRMAEVKDVRFPELLSPVDDLPPATVITAVRGKVVRGTTSDNGAVRRVLVNGREARAEAPNFAEWEVTLEDVSKLEAWAEDAAGNVERTRHSIP